MNQSRLLRLLFRPSLSSGTFVCTLTAVLIGSNAWAYISTKQLFYDYVFGAYGLKTYLWQQSASLANTRDILLASPEAYYLLVGFAALSVGLMVYALLQSIGLALSWRTWSGLDSLGPNRQAIAHELGRRLILRVVTLLGWAIFSTCFFSLLLPFVTLLNQTGIEHIRTGIPAGWLACAGATVILALALHLHVIFLRLACLRPRVFGGANIIEEAEAHSF
jgi:hypothetical protein